MLWEPRGFYCAIDCQPDAWIDEWYVARHVYNSPEAIRAAWISRGFSHLLLFNPGREYVEAADARYQTADWSALARLLSRLVPIEDTGDGYSLYRLDGG